jgi:WD40 repeat protein
VTGAGVAREHDAETGRVQRELRSPFQGPIVAIALQPDGSLVAVGGADRVIRLLDVSTLQVVRELHGHAETINSIAWLAGGERLVSAADDRTVRIWDPESGENLATLRGHRSKVRGVALAPDGQRLVSTGEDGAIRLWDMSPAPPR